jgi:hypothetical protein
MQLIPPFICHTHIPTHTCTQTHAHTYSYTLNRTGIHRRAYTHTHITHTHTHTHTHTLSLSLTAHLGKDLKVENWTLTREGLHVGEATIPEFHTRIGGRCCHKEVCGTEGLIVCLNCSHRTCVRFQSDLSSCVEVSGAGEQAGEPSVILGGSALRGSLT